MADVKWTPAQLDAIEGHGGNILVSAAAGSGKTAVLSQRVLRLLTGETPIDADKLLIVTFSRAAAEEMKQRISKQLWKLAQQRPGDPLLARQQLLLDSAQISTIHSFCINLLRANFHLLELPADFRVGDEREMNVLFMQTAHEVVEDRYDSKDPVFFDLVELVSTTRSDRKLEQTLLKLYGFLRNHPFYEEWLDKVARSYSRDCTLEQSPWFPILIDYAVDAVEYCVGLTETTLKELEGYEEILAAYGAAFTNDLSQLRQCAGLLRGCGWDAARDAVAAVTFGPLGRLAGYPDEETKKRFQSVRTGIKDIIANLGKRIFLLDSQQYAEDMSLLAPVVDELFDMTLEFDSRLSEAKRKKKTLDFGDLEHYSLRLLYDSVHGEHTPSAAARSLREQYAEILIDEYQDTNGVQEMIFKALESDSGNRFLVGDVKQSIYRFRQARPENFIEKKDGYAPFDGRNFPAKIALSANFRTRRETAELINFIFGRLMSRKVGEMEYLQEDELCALGSFDYKNTLPVQMLITDPALSPDADAAELEARMVAAEIKKLLDDGVARPADICILLRSPRRKAAAYIEQLELLGIGAWSDRDDGFLTTREVAPVISYLKLLANPLLDLELAKVLCSHLYGFSSDMLAQLRLVGGEGLYSSMVQLAETDSGCRAFLDDFELLRGYSASHRVSEVLRLLYTITAAEHKAMAMPQGAVCRGNLLLLCELAANHSSGTDLSSFLSYLYALEEYGCDLPSAASSAGNAVSVMSIHKSKGLEFPVVFLCDTASPFNRTDLIDQMQLHPELGFACVMRDNRRMMQHRTVQLEAMTVANRGALLSEELRVLYVALTRTRERLYITAADKKLSHLRRGISAPYRDGRPLPWMVRGASCYLDWLALALGRHPDFPCDVDELTPRPEERCAGQGSLAVRFVLPLPEQTAEQKTAGEEIIPAADEVERLREAMHWEYPFLADTETPVKLSVSQLSKGGDKSGYFFTRRPRLLTGQGLTPTERGVAAHKFMQFADYRTAAADPAAELARLTEKSYLTPEEGAQVDVDSLRLLFESELGKRLAAARRIEREIRFICEFTPEQLAAINPQYRISGNTVVQGVADCVIIEDGMGTIIDYKTDRVKSVEELDYRYRGQLLLYRHILVGLLELPIEQCILYSFHLNKALTLKL